MNRSLKELATVHYGKSPDGYRTEESAIPIIGTGGQYGFATESLFDGPLVVVARKGTLGKPTFSQNECWVVDTAYAVIANGDVDTKWLYYNLANFNLDGLNEATGVPSISRDYLFRVSFPTPPLARQRKITKILTTVDNLIEKTEALIAKYQAIKQGMMHDLFTRGVDTRGHLRPTYDEAPELYKESDLGWIPKKWELVKCDDICKEIVVGIVIQPAQYYISEGVPVLRSANVRETGIDPSDLVYMSEESNRLLAKSMLHSGDIVTVRTGYPGTSCVVTSEFDGANCVDILISRPGPRIRSAFLSIWINSDYGKNQVLRMQGGLAQQHFNVGELKNLLVALPSSKEQERMESALFAQQAQVYSEGAQLLKLKALKTGLMQDLLTGKVRVKVDESEEATDE